MVPRRRRLEKPIPPPGLMSDPFGDSLATVEAVEDYARNAMAAYDALPRELRDIVKLYAIDPQALLNEYKKNGMATILAMRRYHAMQSRK